MNKLKLIALIAVCAIFCNCTKQGATGAPGANGSNGVANISSVEFNVSTSQWTSNGGGWFYVNLTVPAITDLNTDNVSIDIATVTTDIYAIPTIDLLMSGDVITYNYTVGTAQILYYSPTNSAPAVTLLFKVTVIPPA